MFWSVIKCVGVIVLWLVSGLSLAAQEKSLKQDTLKKEAPVFFIVEDVPEFPGGEKAFKEYLNNTVKYPKEAMDAYFQGRVYIAFKVDTLGKVYDVKIARGVGPLLDKEAIRVMNNIPDWRPANGKGKSVEVAYVVPFLFTIDSLGNSKVTIEDIICE